MITRDIFDVIEVSSYHIPENMDRRRILSITHNSKFAGPTSLFVCKSGSIRDGHFYARQAYEQGTRLFLAERPLDLPSDAAVLITDNTNEAICKLAIYFYDNPARDMKIIGVTGTKGKTTVAMSVYSVATARGIKMGYIGTNGVYYNGCITETVNTTPDPLELQRHLKNMKDAGVEFVIIEVSSQALWQKRIYGIEFEICAFTNLYEDHIGGIEHPTFEHYRDCKQMLFTDYNSKNIVINSDSGYANHMLDGVQCSNIVKTSALGYEKAKIYAKSSKKVKNGIVPGVSFTCYINESEGEISSRNVFIPLPGMYSIENGLIIIAICRLLNISLDDIVDSLSASCVPGRFEAVELQSRPGSLFVIDYAHNGASLEAVLSALREYEPSRIICLFGSVGGRTFGRRRELGLAARNGADVIIVTSDNPDGEDPMQVIDDICEVLDGCKKEIHKIPDRYEAINKAFELAEPNDYVLLAGKGHESYQLIKGKRIPFSEKAILKQIDLLSSEVFK